MTLMLFTARRAAARNYPDATSPRPSESRRGRLAEVEAVLTHKRRVTGVGRRIRPFISNYRLTTIKVYSYRTFENKLPTMLNTLQISTELEQLKCKCSSETPGREESTNTRDERGNGRGGGSEAAFRLAGEQEVLIRKSLTIDF